MAYGGKASYLPVCGTAHWIGSGVKERSDGFSPPIQFGTCREAEMGHAKRREPPCVDFDPLDHQVRV